jgi:glycosyltransferase involved in cell wall biosynthesis
VKPSNQPTATAAAPRPADPRPAFRLSVLMPVYDERFLVETAVARVLAFESPWIQDLELVIVDDGSRDGTGDLLRRIATGEPRVRLIHHERNRGKGAALRTAIAAATGDLAVVQDADLEYDPTDWSHLLLPFVEADADAVYGSRFLAGDYRRVLYFWHTVGNRLLTVCSNAMTGLNLTDMETCYKMVRTALLQSIPLRSDDFSVEVELTAKLAKRGAVVYEVPIRYRGRTYREGKKINWRHGFGALASIVRWRLIDDLYRDDPLGAEILTSMSQVNRFNRWMADFLDPWVGERVLEIGAGIGNLTHQFLPRPHYLATDLNPHYLGYLHKLAKGRPYMRVAPLDLADDASFRALGDRGFDTVICLNVLEHVPDEAASLDNLFASLKPRGRAIVLVPQGQWLYSSLDTALGHVKRYSRGELKAALERAGFEVEALVDFNKTGVPGWFVNGKLFRRTTFSRVQLKVLNTLMPAVRRLDRFLPWHGLSVVGVGRRP